MDETIKDTDMVYVSNNLVMEPLVAQWYAWTHLISPSTASMHVKHKHLSIMDSYIKYPKAHAAAVARPEMLGGPFIDYQGQRVDEIDALRTETIKKSSRLLELATSIQELTNMLMQNAKGHALADLYSKVPEKLKGLVELYYDINNNPSFRFFEPLLYNSEYYDESMQSVNMFVINDDDSRPFVWSTPRLASATNIQRTIAFSDPRIDMLFQSAVDPIQFRALTQSFEITESEESLFKSFFTRSAPKPYAKYQGDGVLTRYFGHASILMETKDTSIMVDPVISYGYETDISRYTFADLPDKIDYVCITHNHQDHVLIETLIRIRYKIGHIIVPRNGGGELQDPSLKLVLQKLGFKNVIEIDEMETLHFKSCTITGIPFLGEHADLNIRTKICHLVSFKDNFRILLAADSCNQEPKLYERIHKLVNDIDVIFLGMECDGAPLSWLYGPLLPKAIERDKDQSRRLAGCDFVQAKTLIDIFNPKNVFVYAMGMEPWLEYISAIRYTDESRPIKQSNQVLEYCKAKGIVAERLFGERILEYVVN